MKKTKAAVRKSKRKNGDKKDIKSQCSFSNATSENDIFSPHVILYEEEVTSFNCNPDSVDFLKKPTSLDVENENSVESHQSDIPDGQRNTMDTQQLSTFQIGSPFNHSPGEGDSASICLLTRPKKSLSFSPSLGSYSESCNTPEEISFNSTKSILNLRDYRHTSTSIDLETTNLNITRSGWDSVDPNASSNLHSNQEKSEDGNEIKHGSYLLDYDDLENLQDSSDMKSPRYTSTPCKSQATPPDLINISKERKILQTLEANDEKLPNITFMVDSMEEDIECLKQIAKRKESDTKMLKDSFAEMSQCLSMAEELNNSISSRTECNNLYLCSQYESSKDDLDCSSRQKDLKFQPIREENQKNDLKEELNLLRREFFALESRIVDLEESDLHEKLLEIQDTRNEVKTVRKTVDSSVQCDNNDYPEEEALDPYSRLGEKENNSMPVASTWERFDSSLLDIGNNLKKDMNNLKEKFDKEDPYQRQCFDASIISDSEYEGRLMAIKLIKKELDSTWSEQKKTAVSKEIKKIESDIHKRKNLLRLFRRNSDPHQSHLIISQRETSSREHESKSNLLTAMERPVISAADAITKSKLWRTAKIGLVLPLTIMFIGSVNFFLEPNCCDNFYSVSYSPYLEYRYGPPPI